MGVQRFVLVHGAWHGGWCWRDVLTRLEGLGHEVHAPTLPGLGARAAEMSRDVTLDGMVEDTLSFLADHDLQRVVLVGHSFGGAVITGVADRAAERLARLVYLDAAVLEHGETAFDVVPDETVAERRRNAEAFDGGISMPPPSGETFGLGPEQEWAIAQLTPHPLASYESPLALTNPVGNGLPITYVACTDPWYAGMESSRKRAAERGWPIKHLASAHDAMILAPEATTAALL